LVEISFGEWLRRQRKAQGWTQEQLALQVSCSVSALRKIEADQRRASVQTAELFAKAFNISPNERSAFQKFARGEWQSASSQFIEEAPWRSSPSPRLNIPSPVTSLIGREQEIAEIREYLLKPDVRLVTLVGPPGIGKTRLSLASAHEALANFLDGVFFVALAPLEDPSLIAPAILQVLGYIETKNKSGVEQIVDGIGDKQMLLVLDNFEHLIDDAAPLASRLLSACSRLKIMVTSRESLRVSGEWLYHVPTLKLPRENSSIDLEAVSTFPALTLFAERARAVRSDFTLNSENIRTVASICAQLDGLPLAIELIATRIRLMSPQALLERLNEQFVLSADGMRPASARQKTLNNAIGWSYSLLSSKDQKLFAHLSVFAGGFTLDAVESIFSQSFPHTSVPNLITSLLDKSLIQRTSDKLGEIRYDMLVTVQQFALNSLRQAGKESETRDHHLAYFLHLAEQADKESHGPDQIKWMDHLTNELDNFRAALNWCFSSMQTDACLQLFSALAWTWNVRWSPNEARSWFYKIRAISDVNKFPENYARILNSAGLREWRMGNYNEARSILEESLTVWLKLGMNGDLGQAEALNRLGMAARWGEADNDRAESYFNQSLALYQRQEDDWGVAWNLFHLGGLSSERDQDESALTFLKQSLSIYNELGDPWGVARVSQFLGTLYLKLSNYEKAYFYFDQHLRNDERLRFMDGVSVALSNFGELYRRQGDYVQAEHYYEKSLIICREHGMKLDIGVNLYNLGMLALHQNDFSKASRHFTDYFETARTTNEKTAARDLFIGFAAVAGGTNQPERAAKLLGAAQAIFDTTDKLFSPFDRAEVDRHIQIARNQLGFERFESLQGEGRAIFLEDAVAYALGNQN
jgi:predicted ATPase/DNA-binding XRE family transcriptional regulator